ncbi:hypothetical protein ACMXYQ_08435 [Neptuniibacter sp. PT34_22]|uniref:hypothetical protein n=1 Tax=Neptuniibacter sp. PT34_22 TaxID=3398205 RepID=UPI0039F4BF42
MKPILTNLAVILTLLTVFSSGLVIGNNYQVTDFLCPGPASPYLLEEDFVSENGVVFPKGTVIPLRKCTYMQRFKWNFAIDSSVELTPAETSKGHDYGFSVLGTKVK